MLSVNTSDALTLACVCIYCSSLPKYLYKKKMLVEEIVWFNHLIEVNGILNSY